MVERGVSVRLAAIGGQQVKNELANIGREGSRALNQVADGGRRLGGSIQNAAYQVQDFAVHVAYGTSAGRAGGAIRKAAEEVVPPLEETHTAIDQIVAALCAHAEQASGFGIQIGDALTGAFQAAKNAVGDFVRTGKLDVRSLVVSILADLAQLSIRNAGLGPLAQGLSGALGGGGFIGQIGKVLAGKFHSGGKVGLGTPTSVSAAALMSAPRFHMGGNSATRRAGAEPRPDAGARGGPERRTQIVELTSGDEDRNASWADSRRRYDAAYGIRRADDLATVVSFFRGPARAALRVSLERLVGLQKLPALRHTGGNRSAAGH